MTDEDLHWRRLRAEADQRGWELELHTPSRHLYLPFEALVIDDRGHVLVEIEGREADAVVDALGGCLRREFGWPDLTPRDDRDGGDL